VTAFEVLAEPTRREVLDLLLAKPRSVSEIADRLRISQPAASKHLRVLREAGFVNVRSMAQRRIYALRHQPLSGIDAWLAPYRKLWSRRLDALEAHLARKAKKERRT
jgi:DNA-binding transcriptional ArsR family regulator